MDTITHDAQLTTASNRAQATDPKGKELGGLTNDHRALLVDRESKINVGAGERWASALVGAGILTLGVRRRSLTRAVMLLGGGALLHRGITGRCQVYGALGVNTADADGRLIGAAVGTAALEAERPITIGRSAEELHRLWEANLSRIVHHFAEAERGSDGLIRWTLHNPLGAPIEWETRVVENRPGELLRWEAVPGGGLHHQGSIQFRPARGDRGTIATLFLRFELPGGGVVEKALGALPRQLVERSLQRFKSLAEAREIASTEHNPTARARAARSS